MSGSGPRTRRWPINGTTRAALASAVLGLLTVPALPAGPAIAAPQALAAAPGAGLHQDQYDHQVRRARAAAAPVRPAATLVNTITIQTVVEDASVESKPNYAPYTSERLLIGGGGTLSWRAALRFDLAAIPPGARIQRAEVGLYFDGYCLSAPNVPLCGGTSHQLDLRRVTAPWTASTVSDKITFAADLTSSYTLAADASQGWMSWPVTGLVQSWRDGVANYGVMISRHDEVDNSSGPATPGRRFTGSPALRPRLVVSYTSDAVNLAEPTTVHSTGAELSWTAYAGSAPFSRYTIYRNDTPVAQIGTRSTTTYRDTQATPGTAVRYKVVVNGADSNSRTVTLPAAGHARTVLRMAPATSRMTYLYYSTAVTNCANYGAMPHAWVGTATNARWRSLLAFDVSAVPRTATVTNATLSLWRLFGPNANVTVDVHRVTAPWTEGTGTAACTGDGATWYDASTGRSWLTPGGLYDTKPVAAALVQAHAASGADPYNLTGLVRGWVAGTTPNHGVLLRLFNESLLAGNSVVYASDDYAAEATLRPTLTITYTE
jgi:hypothetical protein